MDILNKKVKGGVTLDNLGAGRTDLQVDAQIRF